MLLSWTLSFFLAVVTAEIDPVQIENKNINVNVNINAKEIAEELWKIIELHLKHDGNSITRRLMQEDAVNDLEEVIRRVVEPTRRLNLIAEVELAKNYERIVRRALPIFGWSRSFLDPLANINDVVDDMMWATKTLINQRSKTPVSKEKPAREQILVTDHGEATWSFILRRIMKSLKNIENSLQSFVQQLAIDKMSRTYFSDLLSYPENLHIKIPTEARGRSEKNENFNKNYNVIESAMAAADQQPSDDDEFYDYYGNYPSDPVHLVDDYVNIPYAVADRGLWRQKAFVPNPIGRFDPEKQEGMQDVIPKRDIFPSTVAGLENYLKTKENLLGLKKRPDDQRATESDSGKSKNRNMNENVNVNNFKKKTNYGGKSKKIRMPNDDNHYKDQI